MLREGQYKYVRALIADEIEELYDLSQDPEELINLAVQPEHTKRSSENCALPRLKSFAKKMQALPMQCPQFARVRQTVALKFLPSHLAHDEKRLEYFHEEVRLTRQISHPNVCRVYEPCMFDRDLILNLVRLRVGEPLPWTSRDCSNPSEAYDAASVKALVIRFRMLQFCTASVSGRTHP